MFYRLKSVGLSGRQTVDAQIPDAWRLCPNHGQAFHNLVTEGLPTIQSKSALLLDPSFVVVSRWHSP